MARPLRIEYDGAVYHITSRGNAKRPIFKEDNDRTKFLETLQKVNKRYNWLCHAYCLMTNHYHLVVETPDGNLSKGMRQLNGIYTQTFNKEHNKVGHLFQGRYKAVLIQKDSHLMEVLRYAVLNPVRAKLVEKPEQWKWSSYKATAGRQKPHPCLTTDWILSQFGRKKRQAEKQYRDFVISGIDEDKICKDIRTKSILGEEDFVKTLLNYLRGYEDIQEIPKSQRYISRPGLNEIFSKDILSNKRKRNSKIRKSVYKYGYSQKEIARYLGMHYASISRLVNEK
ncbi:transposase IS200 like protein [bacterium BMS3Abin10]|nr:transposase IS200 like protein [bacterium BMS3Abin10]GBE38221.1 transposase IS200 like protein [bacterium BMS3Bbin08]HDH49841.1 addiction module toxin RelE [Nitrospirota bacterium]